ncbi:MAG: hypothetical protein ACJAZV_002138, partial [Roseivirga sp.]
MPEDNICTKRSLMQRTFILLTPIDKKGDMSELTSVAEEPLLKENKNRFVLFP